MSQRLQMVELDYFTRDGAWYSSAVFETAETVPARIVDQVRQLKREDRLPGLASFQQRNVIVLVHSPLEYGTPRLLL